MQQCVRDIFTNILNEVKVERKMLWHLEADFLFGGSHV